MHGCAMPFAHLSLSCPTDPKGNDVNLGWQLLTKVHGPVLTLPLGLYHGGVAQSHVTGSVGPGRQALDKIGWYQAW